MPTTTKPKTCETCNGPFPLPDPEACHVLDVMKGMLPKGSPELGKHYFCKPDCVEAYGIALDKKYAKTR